MKINSEKSNQVDRPDEPSDKKNEAAKSEGKKDFKELLKGKKDEKAGKSLSKRPSKEPSKEPLKEPGKMSGQASKQAPAKLPGKQMDGFGKRLKGGELQLGQQLQKNERLGTERHVARNHDEARLEHRHRNKHHKKVQSEHTDKYQRGQNHRGQNHRGQDAVSTKSRRGAGGVGLKQGSPGPKTARDVARAAQDASASSLQVGAGELGAGEAKGAAKAEGKTPVDQSKLRAEVAELAKQLVDRAHVGRDASGRQIMLLDLQVPGRGNVRVRLRRRGDGFELRMRPENEELARDLRREREHFRQSAAEGGVDFTSIEIV